MDVRLRFPIKHPFTVDDHWPLTGNGAELTLETSGREVNALVVTFRDQPVELAPTITELPVGQVKAHVNIKGEIEARGRRIVHKFIDYLQLYFLVDVEIGAMEAEYVATSEQERARIQMPRFESKRHRPVSRFPFSLLSQAYFAGESSDDPSFPARMFQLARESMMDERFIDAFRYCFMLFEALFGDGKFQKRDLVRAFIENAAFRSCVADTIRAQQGKQGPGASGIVSRHATPEALISYLVDRRGFYFHGNLAHPKAWHPDREKEAELLAELCLALAGRVSHLFAAAMFTPEMNARVLSNAKTHGATMTIEVSFRFIDAQGMPRGGKINFNGPGTKPTNSLAIRVHKQFLDWAETELHDATLLSTIARDRASGVEIFRCEYPAPTDSQPSTLGVK